MNKFLSSLQTVLFHTYAIAALFLAVSFYVDTQNFRKFEAKAIIEYYSLIGSAIRPAQMN